MDTLVLKWWSLQIHPPRTWGNIQQNRLLFGCVLGWLPIINIPWLNSSFQYRILPSSFFCCAYNVNKNPMWRQILPKIFGQTWRTSHKKRLAPFFGGGMSPFGEILSGSKTLSKMEADCFPFPNDGGEWFLNAFRRDPFVQVFYDVQKTVVLSCHLGGCLKNPSELSG